MIRPDLGTNRMALAMFKSAFLALNLMASTGTLVTAEDQSRWPIKPSEAALIAQQSVPGAVVLNVRTLPSGQYVVTLRAGNNVLRVTVNATNGEVN